MKIWLNPLILVVAVGCKAAPEVPSTAPASAAPASTAPASTAVKTAPVSAAPTSAAHKHPGSITFVAPDGTEKIKPAASVPESIRWADVGDKRVPVLRIVRKGTKSFMEITRYGPKGEFLDVTSSVRPPPRAP